MKSIKSMLFFLVLSLLIFRGCEKDNINKVQAEIIGFVPEKCGCCWGWEINVGNDTIKANSLPDISIVFNSAGEILTEKPENSNIFCSCLFH